MDGGEGDFCAGYGEGDDTPQDYEEPLDEDFFFSVEPEPEAKPPPAGPDVPDRNGACWINQLPADLFIVIYAQLSLTQVSLDLRNVCHSWRSKITLKIGHLLQSPAPAVIKFGPVSGMMYSAVGPELIQWNLETQRMVSFHTIGNVLEARPSEGYKMVFNSRETVFVIYSRGRPTYSVYPLPLSHFSSQPALSRKIGSLQGRGHTIKLSPNGNRLAISADGNLVTICTPPHDTPSTTRRLTNFIGGSSPSRLGVFEKFGFFDDEYMYTSNSRDTPSIKIFDLTGTVVRHIPSSRPIRYRISEDRKKLAVLNQQGIIIITQHSPGLFSAIETDLWGLDESYHVNLFCAFSSDFSVLWHRHPRYQSQGEDPQECDEAKEAAPPPQKLEYTFFGGQDCENIITSLIHEHTPNLLPIVVYDKSRMYPFLRCTHVPQKLVLKKIHDNQEPNDDAKSQQLFEEIDTLAMTVKNTQEKKLLAYMDSELSIHVRNLATGQTTLLSSTLLMIKEIIPLDKLHIAILGNSNFIYIYRIGQVGILPVRKIPIGLPSHLLHAAKLNDHIVKNDFLVLFYQGAALEYNWSTGEQLRSWTSGEQHPVHDPHNVFKEPVIMEKDQWKITFPDGREYEHAAPQDTRYFRPRWQIIDKNTLLVAPSMPTFFIIDLNPVEGAFFREDLKAENGAYAPRKFLKQCGITKYFTYSVKRAEPDLTLHLDIFDKQVHRKTYKVASELYQNNYIWVHERARLVRLELDTGHLGTLATTCQTGIEKVVEAAYDMVLLFTRKKLMYCHMTNPSIFQIEGTWTKPEIKIVREGKSILVFEKGVLYHLKVVKDKVWIHTTKGFFGSGALSRMGHVWVGETLLVYLDGVVACYDWESNSTFYRILEIH